MIDKLTLRSVLCGAPSVVFDAVAVVVSKEGAAQLKAKHAAKGFVADAYAHAKFIAMSDEAQALLDAAGVTDRDAGMVVLGQGGDADDFVAKCAALRFWDRIGGANAAAP